MEAQITPGKYVIAVSGGVDSMVLLDVLSKIKDLELVVAHYDHGIRTDSGEDRELVAAAAQRYGLPFIYEEGRLGAVASESTARDARYDFLRRVMKEQGAQAIITAHHRDDMLETAIINMLRGTGRKGLSALGNGNGLVRPLLAHMKQAIQDYAAEHDIVWHEDSTNSDEKYLRNYVRRNVLNKFDEAAQAKLLEYVEQARDLNERIDVILRDDLHAQPAPGQLNRKWFIMLPYSVSAEVMAAWLRQNYVKNFDRSTIDRLVVASKTARPGKHVNVVAGFMLDIYKDRLVLTEDLPS